MTNLKRVTSPLLTLSFASLLSFIDDGPTAAETAQVVLAEELAASQQKQGNIQRSHSGLQDTDPLPALVPRDKTGHQFVLYADCCSGIQGGAYAANLRRVNRIVARLRPAPDFIAFPGDAISAFTTDYDALRRQWDYWYKVEMKWLQGTGIPLYQSTSNHNTYDPGSEEVFRQVHRHLPQNGPADQKGLACYVRRGNLLYVSTHQPDRRWAQAPPSYRPDMVFDADWLDRVLTEHKDAKFKFVAGHYPVFPVNGYIESPLWCFKPEERAPFWNVLVRHEVNAYLASHIIAFDAQIHEGVPQIVSGGAGTVYGPDGAMPGLTEYLHAVQLAIDDQALRYQVLDVTGTVREQLSWPFSLPVSSKWEPMEAREDASHRQSDKQVSEIVAWRFRGMLGNVTHDAAPQTLLCGWRPEQDATDVWVGFDGNPARLTVRLLTGSKLGVQTWEGASFKSEAQFDFQLALHPGMGPGGILYRRDDSAPWSSLISTSPKGAEDLTWPCKWAIGRRYGNDSDQPFFGEGLQIVRTHVAIQAVR